MNVPSQLQRSIDFDEDLHYLEPSQLLDSNPKYLRINVLARRIKSPDLLILMVVEAIGRSVLFILFKLCVIEFDGIAIVVFIHSPL
jgi:hypothetical protein